MPEIPNLDPLDFDSRIDAALDTYGDPDPGLDQRVLARISAGRAQSSRFGKFVWATALTAAACALLFVFLAHRSVMQAPGNIARNAPTLPQLPKEVLRVAPQAAKHWSALPRHAQSEGVARQLAANRLPKLEIFPTPRPLSSEEQVLVDFAAQAPRAEREAFVRPQRDVDDPITITKITIAPLQIPPLEPPLSGAN